MTPTTITANRYRTPSPARLRIIAAALDLFAVHGVGGTSLQMIADKLGVTKAAVYHKYRTKDEIVVAVAESELARLDAVVTAAEAHPTPDGARDALLEGMVDLAIERGRWVSALLGDPVIGRMFFTHEVFGDVMDRLTRVLVGPDVDAEGQVETAMLIAAISGAVMHPFSANLAHKTLRKQLLRLARRFLDLPS